MRPVVLAVCLAVALAWPDAAPAAVNAGHTGWTWSNPLPQGGDLHAIAFAGPRGVAVGADGLILRTEDGGATWSSAVSGTETGLVEVAMLDANTVYAGGGCVLRRSDDGGATFQRVSFSPSESDCNSDVAQIAFVTPSQGYLVLMDGTVLRTANGGRSFTRRTSLPIGNSVVPPGGSADAVFLTDTTGYVSIAGSFPSAFRTEDGGQTWEGLQRPFSISSMRFFSPSFGYVVGRGGGFAGSQTVDGGRTWAPLPFAGANAVPHKIRCSDPTACVTLGGAPPDAPDNLLTWTADGGQTATTIALGTALSDVAYSSPTRIVGIGAGGVTLASDDGGRSFAGVGTAIPGPFTGLRRASGHTVFAFASSGALARSLDAGLTWQRLDAAPLGRVMDVSFTDDTFGYALTGAGALQHTDDGGLSWAVRGARAAGGRGLLATGSAGLLVATTGGLLRSTDAGATLRRAAGPRRAVRAIDRAGTALIAFGAKALLASGDGGARWRALGRPPGGTIAAADFVSARIGYVVRDDGEVLATRDAARSWRLLAGVGRDDVAGVSFGDASRGFLTLSRRAGLGGVLRTSDGGRTWRPQVIGRRPLGDVLALGSGGGVGLASRSAELFATASGGDAGARSRLSLRLVSRRATPRGTRVTLGGRLRPAPAGAGVSVTAYIGGRWVRKFAPVSGGRFRTAWTLRRGAVFVAQWRGGPGVQADGTAPLRVRVGRQVHR
ncbi:MAG: hypothetical protein QOH58_3283 [Thermoleophilaceae bacterium]|jgi:photosystem II stability/assembly factor-like uncharacterized protein|nr:hypothetical protein [Thermoleophilaceae bacterium]